MAHDKVRYSLPAFDSLMMLRVSGDGSLTTTGTYNGVAVYESPVRGWAAKVVVPARAADTQLIVFVQAADTDADGSYVTIAQSEGITATGEYAVPFGTQKDYVRLYAEVAGTTPDFGAVQVGIVPRGF